MSSCLIVGYSYVWRLRDFVAKKPQPDADLAHVRFEGEGGARLFGPAHKRIIPILDRALSLGPYQLVYLNVGSNDAGKEPVERIVQGLISLAGYIRASFPGTRVAIGQLHFRLHRFRYNADVRAINAALEVRISALPDPAVSFVHVRGLCKPPPSYYCDGVHYNHKGEQCLLRAVRKVVRDARPVA
jgi:lysophospholipase L1-like esterase